MLTLRSGVRPPWMRTSPDDAMLATTGAVRGGRVVADWPGLKEAQLYEARDLKPTTDLRAVLKGVLADQFGLSPAVLGTAVFPGTLAVRPMQGLVA